MNPFWQVNVGQILSVISILLTLWKFHQANVKRIKEQAAEWKSINDKLDFVHAWVAKNAEDFITMKSDVKLMNDWFKHKVFGGGSE